MFDFPIKYNEPLFRPPSEAYSLIFQVTTGCSWNHCAFCEMYTMKQFGVKNIQDIKKEVEACSGMFPDTRKVFLGDGDAMALSIDKLNNIVGLIKEYFPKVSRISAYASSRNLKSKTTADLKLLKELGLKLLYVGIESGSNQVLGNVNKGEKADEIKNNLMKARDAGIKLSVMILNGLGGKELTLDHAEKSADVINHIQPEYLSTLVLSYPKGLAHFQKRYMGNFTPLNPLELLNELGMFIKNCDLKQTVFRSDHASNYLPLKGILGRDKPALLKAIETAVSQPSNLREEWQRGL